jgi:hypothetical protein
MIPGGREPGWLHLDISVTWFVPAFRYCLGKTDRPALWRFAANVAVIHPESLPQRDFSLWLEAETMLPELQLPVPAP